MVTAVQLFQSALPQGSKATGFGGGEAVRRGAACACALLAHLGDRGKALRRVREDYGACSKASAGP